MLTADCPQTPAFPPATTTKQLLFIQGGGEGAYDEDAKLATDWEVEEYALPPDFASKLAGDIKNWV